MKAIIIGNSGSGKTWLAKRLAAVTNAPIVHLDDLFWEPGGFDKKRSSKKVLSLIHKSKQTPAWIVEGVFGELVEHYLDDADDLIWLDLDWLICKQRLEKRGSESKTRLGREQSEAGLEKLIEWASHYFDRQDLRSHQGHRKLFRQFTGSKICLKTVSDINKFAQDAHNPL